LNRSVITRLEHFRATHTSKVIEVGGERWTYVSSGQGNDAFLLLPGALASSDSLFHLILELEQRSRVVAVTLTLAASSISEILEALLAILDVEGVDRAAVIGSSYGGWLAQELAARHPERVRSLVLLHTFPMTPSDRRKFRRWGNSGLRTIRLLPPRLFDHLLRLRVTRLLLSPLQAARHRDLDSWTQLVNETVGNGTLRAMARHQARVLMSRAIEIVEYQNYGGPVLIVESDNDPVVRSKARQALKREYPDAQVHTFTGTGHISALLAPKALTQLLARLSWQ